MALTINTNVSSLTGQRNLNKTQNALQKSLNRLSSGLRINSAKDDAAGLAISNRMTAQIRGLDQAVRNANDGISLAQTAEGALGEVVTNLQRLRELAVQAANATNSASDRAALQHEAKELLDEIQRTATTTEFNGIKLLDGSFTTQQFQVGAMAGQTLAVSMDSAQTDKLGVTNTAALTAQGNGQAFAEGDLVINGQVIRGTYVGDDMYSHPLSSKDSSAIAKAAAINDSSHLTGVTAKADVNYSAGARMNAAAGSGTMYINGHAVEITTSANAEDSRSAVVEAINKIQNVTGVVARDTGSSETGVELRAADGRNITVQYSAPTEGRFDAATTGVRALGNSTLEGTEMTAAAGKGVITINGVNTAIVETTTNAAETRVAVTAAINAISHETGVTAVDTGSDEEGVSLYAADGRQISVELNAIGTATFTNASTGIGTTTGNSNAVYGGAMGNTAGMVLDPQGYVPSGTDAVTKVMVNGEELQVSVGGNGANSFNDAGSFAVTAATTSGSTYTVGINGYNLSFTGGGTNQAEEVVAAINADETLDNAGIKATISGTGGATQITLIAADGRELSIATGVGGDSQLTAGNLGFGTASQASTFQNSFTGSTAAAAGVATSTYHISINGQDISFAGDAASAGMATSLRDAINNDATMQAAGISATQNAGVLTLVAADGRAITVGTGTGGNGTTNINLTAGQIGFAAVTEKATTFDANALATEVVTAINDSTTSAGQEFAEQGVSAVLNTGKDGFVVIDAEGDAIDFTGSTFSASQLGLSKLTFESPGAQGTMVVQGAPVTTTAGSGVEAQGLTEIALDINGVLLSGIMTGEANSVTGTGSVQNISGEGADRNGHFFINGERVDVTGLSTVAASGSLTNSLAIAEAVNTNATLQAAGITASVNFTADNNSNVTFTAADGRAITIGAGTTEAGTSVGITLANLGTVAASTASTFNGATMAENIVIAVNGDADLADAGITAALNSAGTGFVLLNSEGGEIDMDTARTTATAAQLGLTSLTQTPNGQSHQAEATKYSSLTLSSDREIVIESADPTKTMLVSGTYSAQTAYTSTTTNNGLAMTKDNVRINGISIEASYAFSDTASAYASTVSTAEAEKLTSASAIAKVAAFNAVSDLTGVTAKVNTTVHNGASMAGGEAGTGTITINGVVIGGSGITLDAVNGSSSAGVAASENRAKMIQAINARSGETGVVAVDAGMNGGVRLEAADGRNINVQFGGGLNSANTGIGAENISASTTGATATFDNNSAYSFTLNGVSISGSKTSADDVANTINSYSDRTGVTASITDGKLTLSTNDGRAITLGGTAGAGGLQELGLTTADSVAARSHTSFGTYTLSSTSEFTVSRGAVASLANTGLEAGTYGSGKIGSALSELDISTVAGANKAITALDNALTQIDQSRSVLGAVQNRFEATISNLSNASENLSAARGRILDADFAKETSELTKNQIMQQAGVAMLAQANQLPQLVLSLLQ